MQDLAIVGGTLIDGTGRAPIDDAVVLVGGERIINVYRRGEAAIPESARVIDASGKTVLPGLVDCHTHVGVLADNSFLQVDDPQALTALFMELYIRNGVTTVRDTGNFDPEAVLRLLKTGRAEWPRFFGAGPVLDGPADPPAPWRWLQVVDDEAGARDAVRRLIDVGVDFLKVYVWMRPEVMRAVVDEAHRRAVRVTAHVGHVVTVDEAVRLGIDSLEHVRVGRELVAEEDRPALAALPRRTLDPLASFRPWRLIDPASEHADRLIALLAERGVFFTPTLTWSRSVLAGDDPDVVEPTGIQDMPEAVRAQWKQYAYYSDYTEEDFRQGKLELERQMAFVGRAQRGGVKVTAGTDTTNPWVVPGASLHDELRLLVACGLTPLEAITAATGRAAELLGQQNELGTIERRRLADVLIMDGNPLEDIRNTRQIWAVLKGGQIVHGAREAAVASAGA